MEQNLNPKSLLFCVTGVPMPGLTWQVFHGLQYPSNLRTVRVMCSGRVDPCLLSKALKGGV